MTEERIITAAVVTSGEKGDGPELPKLLEMSQENGINVNTIIGDGAYTGTKNLQDQLFHKDLPTLKKLLAINKIRRIPNPKTPVCTKAFCCNFGSSFALKKDCNPIMAKTGKHNSRITCIEETALNLLYIGT